MLCTVNLLSLSKEELSVKLHLLNIFWLLSNIAISFFHLQRNC